MLNELQVLEMPQIEGEIIKQTCELQIMQLIINDEK